MRAPGLPCDHLCKQSALTRARLSDLEHSWHDIAPRLHKRGPRAAQEVESQVTRLDEAEQATGEGAVQGEANAITDAIDALKEALGVQ